MEENTKNTKETEESINQRPFRIKADGRIEINGNEAFFLIDYAQKFLQPHVMMWEFSEYLKKKFIDNGMVEYLSDEELKPKKPKIEVIQKPEPKIVNLARKEIKNEPLDEVPAT